VTASNRIVAVAPANAPGTVNITVTAVGGTSAANNPSRFTYT
jgi:hypothetical protein